MAGGGTGGHVIPLLAVARELRRRGHRPFFVGTARGIEARLVPAEGFPIECDRDRRAEGRERGADAAHAGAIAAWCHARHGHDTGVPPGRRLQHGRLCRRAGHAGGLAAWNADGFDGAERHRGPDQPLDGPARRQGAGHFEEAAAQFPRGKTEVAGLPVREEFLVISPKPAGDSFWLLVTGGSRGSHRLNQAARESWPLFRACRLPASLAAPDRPGGVRGTGARVRRHRSPGRGGRLLSRTCRRPSPRRTWWYAARAPGRWPNWRPPPDPPCWCLFRSPPISTSCATPKLSCARVRRGWFPTPNSRERGSSAR